MVLTDTEQKAKEEQAGSPWFCPVLTTGTHATWQDVISPRGQSCKSALSCSPGQCLREKAAGFQLCVCHMQEGGSIPTAAPKARQTQGRNCTGLTAEGSTFVMQFCISIALGKVIYSLRQLLQCFRFGKGRHPQVIVSITTLCLASQLFSIWFNLITVALGYLKKH